MRKVLLMVAALAASVLVAQGADSKSDWKPLRLVKDGKVSSDWVHIGYGGWVVDNGALRTAPAAEGLGLLVYKKEKLGNCQIKVVYKPKEERSNSGFYIRLDDGILKQVNNPGAVYKRDASGKPSKESEEAMKASAEKDEGIWYGVNHGYEVQIAGPGERGTGSIYSLANSAAKPNPSEEWHTLIVTLDGDRVSVELDGQLASEFSSAEKNLPARTIWHQPKREPKRPQKGYIGLQTHDPNDIVWFKEISVRPLPKKHTKKAASDGSR